MHHWVLTSRCILKPQQRRQPLLQPSHLCATNPIACHPSAGLSSRNLTSLNLAQNNLTGPLPADWANATLGGALRLGLQQLMLEGNNLTGSIPSTYGAGGLPNLTRLTLYQNPQLCGVPPSGAICLDSSMTALSECHEYDCIGLEKICTGPEQWREVGDNTCSTCTLLCASHGLPIGPTTICKNCLHIC